jgi:hypothetical protein
MPKSGSRPTHDGARRDTGKLLLAFKFSRNPHRSAQHLDAKT